MHGTLHSSSEFPLILGRDFSGHIVDMGCGVDQNIYRVGDAVSPVLALVSTRLLKRASINPCSGVKAIID